MSLNIIETDLPLEIFELTMIFGLIIMAFLQTRAIKRDKLQSEKKLTESQDEIKHLRRMLDRILMVEKGYARPGDELGDELEEKSEVASRATVTAIKKLEPCRTYGETKKRYAARMSLSDTLVNAGTAVVIVAAVSYLAYMVGLILVLRRLGKLTWLAFIPLANYYAQIRAINAPRRWFLLSLPPYLGAVYMGSVAIRLGSVFGRGPGFSLVWLTIGAPVGMFVLAFSRQPVNPEILDETAKLLDIKAIKRAERA